MKKKRYEVELYAPVAQYFRSLGYTVQAEVHHCDVVAYKDDELVIIELKKQLTLALITQAVQRQGYTDDVYLAVLQPNVSLRSNRWRNVVRVIRRLELGLLLISFEGRLPKVTVVCKPQPFDRKRSMRQHKSGRKRILNEVADRRSNDNIGGSTQVATITAYKEKSIQIAFYLDYLGPMSAKELETLQTGERTYGILYNNYYNWFRRIARGVYDLTERGRKEYKRYPHIINLYKQSPLKRK